MPPTSGSGKTMKVADLIISATIFPKDVYADDVVIPNDYEVVDFRKPHIGELFLTPLNGYVVSGPTHVNCPHVIVKKINYFEKLNRDFSVTLTVTPKEIYKGGIDEKVFDEWAVVDFRKPLVGDHYIASAGECSSQIVDQFKEYDGLATSLLPFRFIVVKKEVK